MRLILVRHGQTACNVRDIWHGWDGCELTDEGLRQAEAAAQRLASERIDAVYSSDTRRAVQTARAIARRHRLEPITDPGLRERYAGQFEGLALSEVLRRQPTVWQDRDADLWGWRPPQGESLAEVGGRAMAAIERIRERHPQGTVVVVSHMATKRTLVSRLAGIPLERTYDLPFPSTGITTFDLQHGSATMVTFNDARHITPAQ